MTKQFLFFIVILFTTSLSNCEDYPYKFEGYFEEYRGHQLSIIDCLLPSNPTVIEAGAFDGTDTLKICKKWPQGNIYSFEPNPSRFVELSAKTTSCENVHCYNVALGEFNGTTKFYICHGTNGQSEQFEAASSLLQPSESMEIHYQGPVIDVPCVVLESWCEDNQVECVDFMWLDLQGMELQVLKTSPKILKCVEVIYIATNMYPFRVGTTMYSELRSFLEASGFTLLAHWYREGLQGDAIFIRTDRYNELFDE